MLKSALKQIYRNYNSVATLFYIKKLIKPLNINLKVYKNKSVENYLKKGLKVFKGHQRFAEFHNLCT